MPFIWGLGSGILMWWISGGLQWVGILTGLAVMMSIFAVRNARRAQAEERKQAEIAHKGTGFFMGGLGSGSSMGDGDKPDL